MPSPPISPTPVQWRSPNPEVLHPDYATLLHSFEHTDSSEHGSSGDTGWRTARESPEEEREEGEAEGSPTSVYPPEQQTPPHQTPHIRTTSPSPQREEGATSLVFSPSPVLSIGPRGGRSSQSPPQLSSGQLFGERPESTSRGEGSPREWSCPFGPSSADLMWPAPGRSRQLSFNTPQNRPPLQQSVFSTPPSDMLSMRGQATGQSSADIETAYDGVFSQLDALARQDLSLYPTPPSTSFNPSKPSARSAGSSNLGTSNLARLDPSPPSIAPPVAPLPWTMIGLGPAPGEMEISRLSSVSERTEPESGASSPQTSPTGGRGPVQHVETVETTATRTNTRQYIQPPVSTQRTGPDPASATLGDRLQVPTNPVRGPFPAGALPSSSPARASELIRMFESRAGGSSQPPPPQPRFQANLPAATTVIPEEPNIEAMFRPPPPPSSFRQPFSSLGPPAPPSPPQRQSSPLSQVRTMIASWRARAGSPSQRGRVSPGRGEEAPRLFGRDRGWNVSIRRRRRHESQEEVGLAEQGEEPVARHCDLSISRSESRRQTGGKRLPSQAERHPSAR